MADGLRPTEADASRGADIVQFAIHNACHRLRGELPVMSGSRVRSWVDTRQHIGCYCEDQQNQILMRNLRR